MGVPLVVWVLTVVVLVALTLVDYFWHVRASHPPTLTEAAVWSAIFVGIAMLFGAGVVATRGVSKGMEYFACYLSNEALSVDNLFVFVVIIGSFAVPRAAQQKVLLFGILVAILARTVFIFVGAALISVFSWAFYLFAIVLLVTAGNLAKPTAPEGRTADTAVIRAARRLLRTSERYDGDRLFTVENGKRVMTPMLLAMIAVGGSDLLFAFDSIPAMFGLTKNIYLMFTATTLSLLGLRQLYFLIDGLLDRLVYLFYGLAAILGFIGVKLMLHALHSNGVPFINGGNPVPVVELSSAASLTVIVVIVVITTAVSLLSARGRAQSALAGARRHATQYLDQRYAPDPAERDRIFARLLRAERQIQSLPEKYRTLIARDDELPELLRQAHRAHEAHNRN
ncbi:TerC/Alx family metal homeostasis membrane protein [Mycobacterium sp.]|uniref:TerC/Alx family metal homeostasis membrane protein n=1 Tax=Mycobacterium sp. TaxID=1785 RepID=UPI00126ADBF6|nr:TerC/Alx family metal homeostasis membrane protein [Mycobacterium sp.]KAA8960447.1 MAG: TerC/Alx family metal homeostasis membrane protein [Mycobacterium sp.]